MFRISCVSKHGAGLTAASVLVSACFGAVLPAQEAGTVDLRSAERGRAALAVRECYLDAVQAHARADLPIGIFDSGTGGLAVMEEILRLDQFDNESHQPRPGGDGRPDFAAEQFLFLADQANMPYGNYPAAGKRDFLVELILCDAIFLLGRPLVQDGEEPEVSEKQLPVKTIVIACNTATAHGKCDIESLIDQAEIDVSVINVIDAGSHGARELLRGAGDATIGVIATAGTVSSGAYPAALEQLAAQYAVGDVTVVQQGSIGLAGAIDGLPDFIDPAAQQPRDDYRGPSLHNEAARIDAAILPRYDFDFAAHHMLWEGDPGAPCCAANQFRRKLRGVRMCESARNVSRPGGRFPLGGGDSGMYPLSVLRCDVPRRVTPLAGSAGRRALRVPPSDRGTRGAGRSSDHCGAATVRPPPRNRQAAASGQGPAAASRGVLHHGA